MNGSFDVAAKFVVTTVLHKRDFEVYLAGFFLFIYYYLK